MDTVGLQYEYLKEQKENLKQIWCILKSFRFNGNNYYRSNQFSSGSPSLDSLRWKKNASMLDVDTDEVKKSFCKTFFEKVVLKCALPRNNNGNDELIQSIDWKIFTEAKLEITINTGRKQKVEDIKTYDLKENKDIKIYDSQCEIILTLPLDINYLSSQI